MNMQAQDIREKGSNELRATEQKSRRAVVRLYRLTIPLKTSALPRCCSSALILLFSVCCLLFAVHSFVYAQQPAAQQRSPASLEEERLNIIRADIQKKIEQLERLKSEIEAAQKALQKAQEGELLKIVKIYEAMPPEEAARRLEALGEDKAVLIISSLKPRTAGRIMAQMDAEKAASISRKMIERSRAVKEKTSQ